jgi:hypothetical protein
MNRRTERPDDPTPDVVKVTEAASEQEAAAICGFLESRGIHATYDKGDVGQSAAGFGPGLGSAFGGRQQILVRGEDLEVARNALAEAADD